MIKDLQASFDNSTVTNIAVRLSELVRIIGSTKDDTAVADSIKECIDLVRKQIKNIWLRQMLISALCIAQEHIAASEADYACSAIDASLKLLSSLGHAPHFVKPQCLHQLSASDAEPIECAIRFINEFRYDIEADLDQSDDHCGPVLLDQIFFEDVLEDAIQLTGDLSLPSHISLLITPFLTGCRHPILKIFDSEHESTAHLNTVVVSNRLRLAREILQYVLNQPQPVH